MTLVKLDSGDYINTEYVTRLGHRYGKLKCDPEQSETLSLSNRDDDEWISITPADKAHIVEAMKPHDTDLREHLENLAKQWAMANELVDDDQDEAQFIEYTTRDECVDQLREVLDELGRKQDERNNGAYLW